MTKSLGYMQGLVIICLCGALASLHAEDVHESVVVQLKSACYLVQAFVGEQSIGLGTGFTYETPDHLVTAFHVVTGATRVLATNLQTGTVFQCQEATAIDRRGDMVILHLNAAGPNALRSREMPIRQGQGIVIYGNPVGLAATLSTGVIASTDIRDYRIQLAASISPGNSGGPVVDNDGFVIGVITSKLTNAGVEGIAFAAPIGRLANAPHLEPMPLTCVTIGMAPDYIDECIPGSVPKTVTEYTVRATDHARVAIYKYQYDRFGMLTSWEGPLSKSPTLTNYTDYGLPDNPEWVKSIAKSADFRNPLAPNTLTLADNREVVICHSHRLALMASRNLLFAIEQTQNAPFLCDSILYNGYSVFNQQIMGYAGVAAANNTITPTAYWTCYVLDGMGNWIAQATPINGQRAQSAFNRDPRSFFPKAFPDDQPASTFREITYW